MNSGPITNPPTERLTVEALQAIRERANYERISTSIWQERQDIAALLADRDALAADLRNAEGWIADVEEREAACCPEDVGFDEYIRHLQAELQEWRGFHNRLVDDIRDLANLITGGYANGKTQDEMLGYLRSGITRMSAELQEARESLAAEHTLGVMRNAMRESAEEECAGKQQVIDELLAATKQREDANANLQSQLQEARARLKLAKDEIEFHRCAPKAVVARAREDLRNQLVEAVRAGDFTYSDGDGLRDIDQRALDEVVKLIQSFNPVPDDVGTRLASPVHDEEPNL